MNKFRFTINALVIAISLFAFASMAHAQASRTWVSGVGDDANPCSRTAPCKTFAGAISKTALNGEINCLDPGGFGAVTITKSITIDCHEIFASILNAGTNGVNIPFANFTAAGETRKTVRLRNLNFNGFDSGLVGINISGAGAVSDNSEVFIEDCLIDGNFGGTARGIFDQRTGANTLLAINNTNVRNMGSTGISIVGSSTAKVAITHSSVKNCAFGVAASQGRISTYDSVYVGNTTSGLDAETGATIEVDHCLVENNGTSGFQANGAGSVIRVSNTTALGNGTLATVSAGGVVSSYGNNQAGGIAFPSAGTSPS
jgi:hypothetical protein